MQQQTVRYSTFLRERKKRLARGRDPHWIENGTTLEYPLSNCSSLLIQQHLPFLLSNKEKRAKSNSLQDRFQFPFVFHSPFRSIDNQSINNSSYSMVPRVISQIFTRHKVGDGTRKGKRVESSSSLAPPLLPLPLPPRADPSSLFIHPSFSSMRSISFTFDLLVSLHFFLFFYFAVMKFGKIFFEILKIGFLSHILFSKNARQIYLFLCLSECFILQILTCASRNILSSDGWSLSLLNPL